MSIDNSSPNLSYKPQDIPELKSPAPITIPDFMYCKCPRFEIFEQGTKEIIIAMNNQEPIGICQECKMFYHFPRKVAT